MNSITTSLPPFLELLDNSVFAWGLIACGLAQLSKFIFEFIKTQKIRPSVIFETGGMPSSHSSLVTATAAGIGWELGFDEPLFAFAATIAFIVMYDASGIRRAAGLTAARVNLLPDKVWTSKPEDSLKESLGHTRFEVLAGSLFGPAIALPGIVFVGSPLHLLNMLGISWG